MFEIQIFFVCHHGSIVERGNINPTCFRAHIDPLLGWDYQPQNNPRGPFVLLQYEVCSIIFQMSQSQLKKFTIFILVNFFDQLLFISDVILDANSFLPDPVYVACSLIISSVDLTFIHLSQFWRFDNLKKSKKGKLLLQEEPLRFF